MAANPDGTYTGIPPDILLAIPVMSIELNADGSISPATLTVVGDGDERSELAEVHRRPA